MLLRLQIDKLYALLINSDPLGSIPRPNKKEGQEKANLLPTVQAALRRHLAVAAVQAPPLLLITFATVICEGNKIQNFQIEGLPKIYLPISDQLFPYATDASADAEVTVAYALSGMYLPYLKKQDPRITTHRVASS